MTHAHLEALYSKHGHAIFRLCRELAASPDAAEALLLGVFGAAAKRSGDCDFTQLRHEAERLASGVASQDALDDALLSRYLAGSLTDTERSDLERTLANKPSAQVRLAVARSERASFYAAHPPGAFVGQATTVIGSSPALALPSPQTKPSRRRVTWVTGAVSIAAAICVAFLWPRGPTPEQVTTVAEPRVATPSPAPPSSPPPQPVSLPTSEPTSPELPASEPARVEGVRTPTGERMMATFDFGEPVGRISLYEGRSRSKAVPSGTSIQVRANIPEPGFVAVLVLDPELQTLRPLAAVMKVEPHWRVLGRVAIDRPLSLIVVFSREPFVATSLSSTAARANEPLAVERQAQINLTLE